MRESDCSKLTVRKLIRTTVVKGGNPRDLFWTPRVARGSALEPASTSVYRTDSQLHEEPHYIPIGYILTGYQPVIFAFVCFGEFRLDPRRSPARGRPSTGG